VVKFFPAFFICARPVYAGPGYLSLPLFFRYTECMTIEQTVEIPENHRIYFDVPAQIPSGKAKVALTIVEFPQGAPPKQEETPVIPLLQLHGIDRGIDTMEAYFARKRAGKILEDAHDARLRGNQ
jgi:hypothetical protein